MKNLDLLSNDFIAIMQTTKNLSPKTILAYQSDLKDFSCFSKDKLLDDTLVMRYVQHLSQERQLQDSAINRKLIVLKLFFKYLYSKNLIEQNYYQAHAFKFKKERKLPKTLAIKETKKLLDYTNKQCLDAGSKFKIWKAARDLALIDVLISTGIRIAEASNISLNDIAYSERTILIHGKGRKQRLIYISCPQTWNNLLQ